jgi:hypothetical protein
MRRSHLHFGYRDTAKARDADCESLTEGPCVRKTIPNPEKLSATERQIAEAYVGAALAP